MGPTQAQCILALASTAGAMPANCLPITLFNRPLSPADSSKRESQEPQLLGHHLRLEVLTLALGLPDLLLSA
jgi:hypothetical protein